MSKFFAACAAAALLSAGPAFAKGAVITSVDYSDLDLATEKGQKTLDRRITAAARSVCPSNLVTGSRITKADRCVSDAVAKVRADLAGKGVLSVASR